MLKESIRQPEIKQRGRLYEQNRMTVNWVEIEPDWAYWIDTESFSFRRVKKRAPVGAVIVMKSRERLDHGRTYVETSFGVVAETGIVELTKKEASFILARQVLEYMRWAKRWPPFTSLKRVLKSKDVEVCFSPTEYDSFVLLMTREMIGDDPSAFLGRLGKHEAPEEPPWRVELAKSGRSRCRSCKDVILEGRFRIGQPYFYEGSLSYRWHHPRCVATRIDVNELENLVGYSRLKEDEKKRLKRLLAQ
jgi:hypothetical protein